MRVKAEQDVTKVGIPAMLTDTGFVEATPDKRVRLVAYLPPHGQGTAWRRNCLACGGRNHRFFGTREPPRAAETISRNLGARNIPVGDDGRFVLDGLNEGTIKCSFTAKAGEGLACRAADDVPFTSGETSEVVLEPIRGVAVEGTVGGRGAGTPIDDAGVGVYGPYRPRNGAMTSKPRPMPRAAFITGCRRCNV